MVKNVSEDIFKSIREIEEKNQEDRLIKIKLSFNNMLGEYKSLMVISKPKIFLLKSLIQIQNKTYETKKDIEKMKREIFSQYNMNESLPIVVLLYDNKKYILDGHHRYTAAKELNDERISAYTISIRYPGGEKLPEGLHKNITNILNQRIEPLEAEWRYLINHLRYPVPEIIEYILNLVTKFNSDDIDHYFNKTIKYFLGYEIGRNLRECLEVVIDQFQYEANRKIEYVIKVKIIILLMIIRVHELITDNDLWNKMTLEALNKEIIDKKEKLFEIQNNLESFLSISPTVSKKSLAILGIKTTQNYLLEAKLNIEKEKRELFIEQKWEPSIPIIVVEVNSIRYIIDGHHRYYLAVKNGEKSISAYVIKIDYNLEPDEGKRFIDNLTRESSIFDEKKIRQDVPEQRYLLINLRYPVVKILQKTFEEIAKLDSTEVEDFHSKAKIIIEDTDLNNLSYTSILNDTIERLKILKRLHIEN